MTTKELVDYCNPKISDCNPQKCKHIKECDRYIECYGTAPFLMNQYATRLAYGATQEAYSDEVTILQLEN